MVKPSFKIEREIPSFLQAVLVQQPVHFVQANLPKLILSEFHGVPAKRPEWPSLFTAPSILHQLMAPIESFENTH